MLSSASKELDYLESDEGQNWDRRNLKNPNPMAVQTPWCCSKGTLSSGR
jgi:hypothetical protein